MIWLIAASLIWGLSFGLIKGLTTGIDPFILGVIRSTLAAVFFLPWFIRKQEARITRQHFVNAAICGSIQIGLMYGPYLLSFKYLKGYEVALFTLTTPLIMAVMIGIYRRENLMHLFFATLLATIGGLLVAWKEFETPDMAYGVFLVQLSNILFATGLLLWKMFFTSPEPSENQNTRPIPTQSSLMFPYFVGAIFGAGILAMFFAHPDRAYTPKDFAVFCWLGIVASGLGFFMWNRGALQVKPAVLAVANNMKMPVAILISILIFGEQANYVNLGAGLAIIMLALKISSGLNQTNSN